MEGHEETPDLVRAGGAGSGRRRDPGRGPDLALDRGIAGPEPVPAWALTFIQPIVPVVALAESVVFDTSDADRVAEFELDGRSEQ